MKWLRRIFNWLKRIFGMVDLPIIKTTGLIDKRKVQSAVMLKDSNGSFYFILSIVITDGDSETVVEDVFSYSEEFHQWLINSGIPIKDLTEFFSSNPNKHIKIYTANNIPEDIVISKHVSLFKLKK
ncbi:hypothetical protein [Herbaspirillum sp.]|uniref:hypothetical protein n=1 Tax=Herbaspirillum sp. TaxID=1890675 RepID=UPI001B2C2391|nr:hypothetical protein [Herbaspirillum sp.]MBO9538296.1 hypothetical protein [Herbaspirillum sp.]